jgi:hypothetical protein
VWLLNKYGVPCNTDQVFAFNTASDPDNPGYFEVIANNSDNTTVAQFTVGAPMTEAQAAQLLGQIMTLTGAYSLGTP